jgi:hypothetical protein
MVVAAVVIILVANALTTVLIADNHATPPLCKQFSLNNSTLIIFYLLCCRKHFRDYVLEQLLLVFMPLGVHAQSLFRHLMEHNVLGHLMELAGHPSANFVLQAALAALDDPQQVNAANSFKWLPC